MASRYSRVAATGSALPMQSVTNDDLAEKLARNGIETSDEWIRTRTGIESRFFAGKNETTLSLAAAAAERALAASGLAASDIDLIVTGTTTPDEVFPSVSCRVQEKLGVPPCAAFDVQAVCSGFVYALSAADSMIRSGLASKALVIGADTLTRLIDPKDRSTCVLFGDGAGAVILEASDVPGIIASHLSADGRTGDALRVPGHIENNALLGSGFLEMNGHAVFKEAVRSLASSAEAVLARAGVRAEDVCCYIPHQANIRIMSMVADHLGIPAERMETAVRHHGNTCAASVPLALDEAVRAGRIKKDDLVLLQGVGAGMTCGSVLLSF